MRTSSADGTRVLPVQQTDGILSVMGRVWKGLKGFRITEERHGGVWIASIILSGLSILVGFMTVIISHDQANLPLPNFQEYDNQALYPHAIVLRRECMKAGGSQEYCRKNARLLANP